MLRTRLIAGTTAGAVLSAVFATALCVTVTVETFVEPLRVDPAQPAPVALRLPPTTLRVVNDEGILELRTVTHTVSRGERVADRITASIVRMYERGRRPPRPGTLVGLWFLYFLIAAMMTSYLQRFAAGRGALLRTQAGVLGLAALLLMVAKAFLLLTGLPAFLVPVGAVALWISLYLDRRGAFMVAVALSFLTASLVSFRLTTLTVYLVSSVSVVALFRDHKHPWTMIPAGLIAGIGAACALVAAMTIFEGGIDVGSDVALLLNSNVLGAGLGGLLSGVIAFALQGLAVLALGAVSRQRLLELTDLDQPLLKKMATEAPGSWEHARAMANLAEAASAAIGADSLLTRVGAYYHDLGKTCQPKYYIENLDADEESPHKVLEPDVSADAIMAHVVEGTKILRAGGIPEPVVEFAYTHHGTSVIESFWGKCEEAGNPKGLTEAFFRYPGMRPRTKETAILMLIDAIEAGSRTVDDPTRTRFEELVHHIIFVKLKQGQLDESGLTMTDLRTLALRITDTLASVYHKRVKYPWQDREERGEDPLPIPGSATEEDVAREREETGQIAAAGHKRRSQAQIAPVNTEAEAEAEADDTAAEQSTTDASRDDAADTWFPGPESPAPTNAHDGATPEEGKDPQPTSEDP